MAPTRQRTSSTSETRAHRILSIKRGANVKPKHQGGYTDQHAEHCERTLITLLRGLGPWKQGIYLAGGLVPRYLIPQEAGEEEITPHVGTTDVDLVLDLELLASVEAYRRLEQNLKEMEFERGANDEGQRQHFSWRRATGLETSVVVDLLRDSEMEEGGSVQKIPGERSLSTLGILGAHLVMNDYIEVPLTAELLNDRGMVTETVRVSNLVPFIVLKLLAFEDRGEPKDAYDIVYCLENYQGGPADVAAEFAERLRKWQGEPLLPQALGILRQRFASDNMVSGARKDGPTQYALFLADPGRTELNAQRRQNAAAAVEEVLRRIDEDQG